MHVITIQSCCVVHSAYMMRSCLSRCPELRPVPNCEGPPLLRCEQVEGPPQVKQAAWTYMDVSFQAPAYVLARYGQVRVTSLQS
jgi:hypothetical protein